MTCKCLDEDAAGCRCVECARGLETESGDFLEFQAKAPMALSSLKGLRLVMISRLWERFNFEFDVFDLRSGHETSEPNRRLALREYVKARTSHLAETQGWNDVAILHKRLGAGSTREEQEKYTRLAEICYREWGMLDHHAMEEAGQIYGPAVPGFEFDKGLGGQNGVDGGHTWAVNAAWLLGHMHAEHRFIQVVPVTHDNIQRGAERGEKGALYYEAALVRFAGMEVGRHEGPWMEFVPTHWSKHMKLGLLTQRIVDTMAKTPYAPFGPSSNIELGDIAQAANASLAAAGEGPLFEQHRRTKEWLYVRGRA